mmetsp:Transcript_3076/g.5485  ORF Transcript_3076/g.5485 Transcript_3076/m.5485 type:complete len:246 (-) Transcript_3076:365-1102(-)
MECSLLDRSNLLDLSTFWYCRLFETEDYGDLRSSILDYLDGAKQFRVLRPAAITAPQYWRERKDNHLKRFALRLAAIKCNSAASERQFSKLGWYHGGRRTNLHEGRAADLNLVSEMNNCTVDDIEDAKPRPSVDQRIALLKKKYSLLFEEEPAGSGSQPTADVGSPASKCDLSCVLTRFCTVFKHTPHFRRACQNPGGRAESPLVWTVHCLGPEFLLHRHPRRLPHRHHRLHPHSLCCFLLPAWG